MSKSAERIIDESTTVFKAKGFNASTVSDIASASGILKGSLYNHFSSKEDILIAVIEEVESNFLEYIQSTELNKFDKILEKTADFFVHEESCLMANLLGENIPVIAQLKVEAFFNNWRNTIINSMDENLSLKDKEVFAEDVIALFEGSVILAKISKSTDPIYRSLSTLLKQYKALDRTTDPIDTKECSQPYDYREICRNGNDDTLVCDT